VWVLSWRRECRRIAGLGWGRVSWEEGGEAGDDPDRDPNSAPAKRSKKKGANREWFGPRTWDELVEQIRAHATDIEKKIEKQVKAVEGLAGGAGHHIGDHVVAGRLEARDITPDLLDELVVLGEIDDGSDDE